MQLEVHGFAVCSLVGSELAGVPSGADRVEVGPNRLGPTGTSQMRQQHDDAVQNKASKGHIN